MDKSITIKNWRVIMRPFGPPKTKCITGQVYGHPKFPDGTTIYTSAIVRIDEVHGVMETENNIYHLAEQAA